MKSFFRQKRKLNLPWTILLFLGISLAILLVSFYLQWGSTLKLLRNIVRDPRLLILNLFPIMAVLGLLYALLGNLFFAGSVTALVFHLLSLIDLIKVECRKDPLVPPDFALLGEAMQATGEYQLDLHPGRIALIIAFALALLLLGLILKRRPKILSCILLALAAVGCMTGAMLTVYPSGDLYLDVIKKVPGLTYTNVPKVFGETGFVYCFLHNVGMYKVEKPTGYEKAEAEAWASHPDAPGGEPVKANVIFVQCEAFSSVFDEDVFSYAPEDNPMFLFHQVEQGPRAVSGRVVVSNFGAGTANTEFDVLTGMQTNMLNTSSALRTIHKNVSSLARVFGSLGYENWFMHPGDRWFYNRESAYHYFGLHNQAFNDDISPLIYKGRLPSDDGFRQELIREYEEQMASSDSPWFAFTVTIQNHQAYPWSKYETRVPDAQVGVAVSDDALETLSVYAEGIRDSSQMLWNLTEYFDGRDEPVILVFWGDHLPTMGANFSVYRELGLQIGDESDLNTAIDTYTTPFLIWGNKAFDEVYDFRARAQALELPTGERISDIYLGALVYEILDMQGTDAYFDFLGHARRTLPVICMGRYVLPDGTLTETLSPEQQAVEDKLHKWTYYRVIDERVTD